MALSGGHGAVEHDGCDACATETPFHKLKHGGKLREDDGFGRHVLGSQLVEVMDECFDLRGAGPVFHFDSVDDGGFLDQLFVLFDFRLFEIDREGNVALWAIGFSCNGS